MKKLFLLLIIFVMGCSTSVATPKKKEYFNPQGFFNALQKLDANEFKKYSDENVNAYSDAVNQELYALLYNSKFLSKVGGSVRGSNDYPHGLITKGYAVSEYLKTLQDRINGFEVTVIVDEDNVKLTATTPYKASYKFNEGNKVRIGKVLSTKDLDKYIEARGFAKNDINLVKIVLILTTQTRFAREVLEETYVDDFNKEHNTTAGYHTLHLNGTSITTLNKFKDGKVTFTPKEIAEIYYKLYFADVFDHE